MSQRMCDMLQLVVEILNVTEMTQRMSDMLQLVVVLINNQLNRNDSPNLKQMIRSLELDAFQLR